MIKVLKERLQHLQGTILETSVEEWTDKENSSYKSLVACKKDLAKIDDSLGSHQKLKGAVEITTGGMQITTGLTTIAGCACPGWIGGVAAVGGWAKTVANSKQNYSYGEVLWLSCDRIAESRETFFGRPKDSGATIHMRAHGSNIPFLGPYLVIQYTAYDGKIICLNSCDRVGVNWKEQIVQLEQGATDIHVATVTRNGRVAYAVDREGEKLPWKYRDGKMYQEVIKFESGHNLTAVFDVQYSIGRRRPLYIRNLNYFRREVK